jgi:hypothetical protein
MLSKADKAYLEEKFTTKAEVLEFKDLILGEMKAMREEFTVTMGYRQHLEDHDERITRVEKHLGFTSA